ncbi:MAG: hypothetical protein HY758_06170, partial [Nitrospirae bacterium]|nr:hypothetical protein [Nitrospirota bacterium]
WALAFKRSHSYPLSALLGIFSSVNRWIGILLLFLLAGSLYIYDKTVSFYAFMCKRCGKIYCSKCEKKVTYDQLCHSCFQALVSLGELTPEERVERILEIQRYKSRRIRRLKVLTLFLPGSGHVYYGWSGYGFLILMAFTFFLFSSLLWFRLSVPESMNPVASMFGWISACGFILIYVITAMRILRRVS